MSEAKLAKYIKTAIRDVIMNDPHARLWIDARIREGVREELAKTARPASDGVCPAANPARTPPSRPVSEGADSDRHPWNVRASGAYHRQTDTLLPIIERPDGNGVTTAELQAELNRLHRAPAEATRKERERCIDVARSWLEDHAKTEYQLARNRIVNGIIKEIESGEFYP